MKTVFQRLGPYEILQVIGHGMAGSVFLARDTRTEQRVALKLIPHGTDENAQEIVAAERSGAEFQKQLSRISSRVPAVFEHNNDEAGYFVAMEYLDGENLATRIARGPLSTDETVRIGIELCLFLEEAHRFAVVMGSREFRSLVHGDLTPRNVRITSSGAVKVLDFGIAKGLSLSRKATRNDFGTLWYLSPERLESGVVDVHADLWAVGVILYEMVRAVRPFQAEDTRRLERLIVSRQKPPSLGGLCPAALEAVIAKLLAASPGERYGTAEAIREDLERFKAGQPTLAEQEGWPGRTPVEPETRRTPHPASEGRARAENEEKTRRTSPPKSSRIGLYLQRFGIAALLIVGLIVLWTDIHVGQDASEAAASASTLDIDELGEAWDRYEELTRRAYFPVATAHLADSLLGRTTELAERVMANYREPVPTVRETQWLEARDALERALVARPNDRQLKAALRYAEGHLHRINGEAHRSRREMNAAQKDLTEAVIAFREAAQLRPEWPDPFLGLARTFIYGLQDVDRGADALQQAERLGYKSGEREAAQLADGYRARGDTLERTARELKGLPQEREYLQRAADAYQQALNQYVRIGDYDKLSANIRATQQAIDRVEKKVNELSDAGAPPLIQPSGQTL